MTPSSNPSAAHFGSHRDSHCEPHCRSVEFAVRDGEVQVRSSSRLGFLDLGVNAKRLNWISAALRAKGWTAPAITRVDYPDYFETLFFTFDDYIRSVLRPLDCPVPTIPTQCK